MKHFLSLLVPLIPICAIAQDPVPILDADVRRATEADAETVRDLMKVYYIFRQSISEEYPLARLQDYSAISCSYGIVSWRWYVGCRPISFSKGYGYIGAYVIGKKVDHSLYASPINGTAIGDIEGMPRIHYKGKEVVIGWYEPLVDIQRVLMELE